MKKRRYITPEEKQKLVDYLLMNYIDKNGNLNLEGLNFGDFGGDICINNMIAKGNIHQNDHRCGGNIYQSNHISDKSIFQKNQSYRQKLHN